VGTASIIQAIANPLKEMEFAPLAITGLRLSDIVVSAQILLFTVAIFLISYETANFAKQVMIYTKEIVSFLPKFNKFNKD
jgi:hypothetical protein